MKKIKLILVAILLLLTAISLKKMDKSKEVQLSDEDVGNFYKEYVITSKKNGVRLKNYFNAKEIFIEKEGIKNIVNLDEKYELLQLNNEIYLKSMNKIKLKKGRLGMKIGENYLFEKNEKFGVLDKNLNTLIEPIYDGLFKGEKSSLIMAKKNKKFGYLNFKGDIIIPFEYEMGAVEKNGLMVVSKNSKVGVIDQNNKEIIKIDYDGIYYDKGDRFIALKNNEYFLIDTLGKVDKIDASWMGVQKNEKIYYERDGKFGIFDFKMNYITKNVYDELSQNYNDLIIAMKSEKYGLIDIKGSIVLSFAHDYILPVGDNYFKVGSDVTGLSFLVNHVGEVKTNQIYDDFIELNRDNVVGLKNEKLILINSNGKEMEEFDSIINFNSKMLLYKKNEKNILRKL